MISELLKGFFFRHFWSPGYTLVNTLTYGLMLALLVYCLIKVFKRFSFSLDRRFFIATLPFIFFGATGRELVDRGFGVYPGYAAYPGNFLLVAPAIYITMLLLTSIVLLASTLLYRKRYHIAMTTVGVIISSYNLYLITQNTGNLSGFALALFFFTVGAASSYVMLRYWAHYLLSQRDSFHGNFLILLAHLLDASATFVGVDYMGYSEKHVLPYYLIEKAGSSIIMFPLKILVVVSALYVIDREYREDEISRRLIKFTFLVLGLGPAIRDLTLIALG